MVKLLKKKDHFGPDGFPLAVARREPQPPFPRHKHQFSELVVITGGAGVHAIRNEEYPVSAGDVFVINDSSPHEYRDMKNLSLVNILYEPEYLSMSKWEVRGLPGYHALFRLEPTYRKRHKFESRLRLALRDLSQIRRFIDQLDEELKLREPGYRLIAVAIFMQMVGYLSRCYEQARGPASRTLLRIGEAISHLENHYEQRINLDELAKIARMSRRNFTRIFREAMGQSAVEYLLNLRITRALELLRNENMNVTEAAFGVGMSDSNYFSRQFRKLTGFSPMEYRKMRR